MSTPEQRAEWRETAHAMLVNLNLKDPHGTMPEAVIALLDELAEWRESAEDLGRRLNKAEYDRDEEQADNQRLRDGITALIGDEHQPTGIPEQATRWYLLGQQTVTRKLRAILDGPTA